MNDGGRVAAPDGAEELHTSALDAETPDYVAERTPEPPAPPPPDVATPDTSASPPDWARRVFALRERLDEPCTYAAWRAASLDLARLNRWTRSYAPTLEFLARVIKRTGVGYEPLHVVDVGCGHGDGLRAVYRWARKRSLPLRLTGVDLNPYAARLARECDRRERIPADAITWVTSDVFAWQPPQPASVIVSSLFAHHLPDGDVGRFLHWCDSEARAGWCLSDLQRSARAARIFAPIARVLGLHPFLRTDGPVSFQRAFTPAEWTALAAEAGVPQANVRGLRFGCVFIERLKAPALRGLSRA